jgi:hypothetical protein
MWGQCCTASETLPSHIGTPSGGGLHCSRKYLLSSHQNVHCIHKPAAISTLAQAAAVDVKQLQQLWRQLQQLWRQLQQQQQQWRQQRRQQEQQQPGSRTTARGAYWLLPDMGPAGKGPAGTGSCRGRCKGQQESSKKHRLTMHRWGSGLGVHSSPRHPGPRQHAACSTSFLLTRQQVARRGPRRVKVRCFSVTGVLLSHG